MKQLDELVSSLPQPIKARRGKERPAREAMAEARAPKGSTCNFIICNFVIMSAPIQREAR